MPTIARRSPRGVTRRGLLLAVATGGVATGLLAACGGAASVATTGTSASAGVAVSTVPAASTGGAAPATSARSVSATTTSAAISAKATTASASAAVPKAGVLQAWMSDKSFDLSTGVGAELMKGFLAQHPGVTIESSATSDLNKFQVQVAGGVPPDFFHTQGRVQTTWGVTGVVVSLDGYIAKAKNVKTGDIWPFKLAELTWQGKTYALPYSIDNRVVFANDDLYRKAGLDPTKLPQSWSDMEAAVSKTAVLEGGTAVKQLGWDPFGGSGGRLTWLVPFWQLGGNYAPGDGSKFTIADDMGVTSLDWTVKIYDMQGGYDAVTSYTKQMSKGDGVKLFGQSQTAHVYGTVASKAQVFSSTPDLQYHVAQYPLPPNGKPATYAGGWAMCIGTGAKNADLAFALMDYFYDPGVQIKWAQAQIRVPPSVSVAQQGDYTQHDPMLELTVQAMPFGRFVPSMPGGDAIHTILDDMVLSVLQKKVGAAAALQDAQLRSQTELDKYRNLRG